MQLPQELFDCSNTQDTLHALNEIITLPQPSVRPKYLGDVETELKQRKAFYETVAKRVKLKHLQQLEKTRQENKKKNVVTGSIGLTPRRACSNTPVGGGLFEKKTTKSDLIKSGTSVGTTSLAFRNKEFWKSSYMACPQSERTSSLVPPQHTPTPKKPSIKLNESSRDIALDSELSS